MSNIEKETAHIIEENKRSNKDLDFRKESEALIDFIAKSPSPYHVIDNVRSLLSYNNMTELSEGGRWKLEAGHSYYVVRGMSSIIAFTMPQTSEYKGYNIVASHSDSPSFKIKENPQMPGDSHYVSLNVEKYGGMIMSTWLDRPLSVAGRAVVAC